MSTDTDRRRPPDARGAPSDSRPDRFAAAPRVASLRPVAPDGMPSSSNGASPLLDRLTDINLDDLFDAAGLARVRNTPLQRLLRPSARRFALLAHEFDHRVGEHGLARGSAWLLDRMTAGTRVSGADNVPPSGPVVVLANHPGMTDTVALLASLAARPDLRVIALDRPFLRCLPNVARQLILVPDDELGRMGVLRAGVNHLKQGGAVLTFPAGEIEPDPVTFGRHKAVESVLRWSGSFVLFARLVPRTRFVPAIVSNVISPAAQHNLLTRLRRTAHDRERLAAALQVALPRYQRLVARVAFGPAQQARAAEVDGLRSAVVEQVRHLIEASVRPADDDADHEGVRRSA
jgi:1-acyl-sn-glycerol-3-phosphate acyltransferase